MTTNNGELNQELWRTLLPWIQRLLPWALTAFFGANEALNTQRRASTDEQIIANRDLVYERETGDVNREILMENILWRLGRLEDERFGPALGPTPDE